MISLPRFFAACGLAMSLGVGTMGVAAAQPSQLPPPDANSASPVARSAQPVADDLINADYSLKQREDRLAALLQSSLADGSLGKPEYTRASNELAAINATEDRLRQATHGELTDTQTFRLEGRIKTLIASLHWNH